ncbi:MAG: hypothetical protein QOH49_4362 [Acidobacteriota bacterium]|jgi:hypothetical protein|nr:hypothetical protein [Acidobacteriota bacterium]
MKTQERTKAAAAEPRWYASAAQPSTPGEMTKAEPADLTQAEPEEDAGAKRRKMRWFVILYVVIATVAVALGNTFDSIYWAAVALFFAIAAQPRERVTKLLRYFAAAAVLVLAVIQFVMLILKIKL